MKYEMTKPRPYELGEPPAYVVEIARRAALDAPCSKTQRGAALFRPHEAEWCARTRNDPEQLAGGPLDIVVSTGHNGQPWPFKCSGSTACRKACGMVCMHAEQRAILAAMTPERVEGRAARMPAPRFDRYDMVHVKVEDARVVPSGAPSCAQCSRMLVEVGVRGIWLLELADIDEPFEPRGEWRFYDSVSFHRETMRNEGLGDHP